MQGKIFCKGQKLLVKTTLCVSQLLTGPNWPKLAYISSYIKGLMYQPLVAWPEKIFYQGQKLLVRTTLCISEGLQKITLSLAAKNSNGFEHNTIKNQPFLTLGALYGQKKSFIRVKSYSEGRPCVYLKD